MGLHRRYARLLKDAPQQMCLSKEEEQKIREQISSLFEGMMRTVYNQEGSSFEIGILSEPGVQNFIEGHAAVLDSAFQQVEMSDVMRQRLNRSDYIFSGMKTFHELNEAFPSLIDENGNRKSFEQFLNDVQSIDKTYNVNYLRAEYNFAQSSATMAAKWEQFMEDGDRYNLQYRTAHDGRVRPEHAALEGVTLPPSDSFWEEYYPPNGWNCRCTVIQVRKTKFPETDHEEAMGLGEEALQNDKKNMFHFNPGKEEKTFPDYNPYTIRRCKDCDIANGKAKLIKFPPLEHQLCEWCKLNEKCAGDKTKSLNAKRKIHYVGKEMLPLLDKNVLKERKNGSPINVIFTMKNNNHLYSDLVYCEKKRGKTLELEDLKNLDKLLANSAYYGEAAKNPSHSNPYDYFYYYKLKVRKNNVIFNVGRLPKTKSNGRMGYEYFLYSVNNESKMKKE